MGYAPTTGAREGFPTFSSSAYGHSQPLPMNEPTLPFEKTSACCGFASSPVLLARESASAVAFHEARPACAWAELRLPAQRPFLKRARSEEHTSELQSRGHLV